MSSWRIGSCSRQPSVWSVYEGLNTALQTFILTVLESLGYFTSKMWSPSLATGSLATLFLAFGFSCAQSGSAGNGVTFPSPTGVSTTYASTTYNASAASTTLANDDFSDERLAFLWNQVGPVATGPVTETVEPTPEPSSYGSPAGAGFHPFIPSYETNLSTASLPEGFAWGVASSAFQIEVSHV